MKSINFDNPLLLLLFIPMVLLTVIPYVIAIRRTNRAKGPKISLVLHLIIAAIITLALSGLSTTTVITETNVYVLADVSYSSSGSLDRIDGYIDEIKDNLPRNSKLGVICFAKDQVVHTALGDKVTSVSGASVDNSATDIAGALDYAAGLFGEGVIKKIVLITDGKVTDNDGTARLINSIESLYSQGVSVDAIYLDNNLGEDAKEVQVSGVDFTESTYLARESVASVLLQSSFDTQVIAELYKDGELLSHKAVTVTRGYNVVNFPLATGAEGVYDYTVKITANEDESPLNNEYSFTQEISGKVKVLLISSNADDVDKVNAMYGTSAEIVSYINNPNIPTTVEELCEYDEIILSSVDIRSLNNVTSFLDALQKAVFNFGKSLLTAGDLSLQNKTNNDLVALEDMLPITYGNNDNDPKLFTIIIDSSRSMQMASRLTMTKATAIKLLDLISPNDHIAIISFSGDVVVKQAPIPATNKGALIDMINAIEPSQGTFIGKSLSVAHELMKSLPYHNKQVMLISDGMSYSLEADNPTSIAGKMLRDGIRVSTVNPRSTEGAAVLREIAASGGGKCYEIENEDKIEDFVNDQISDDITETVIEAYSPVRIDKPNHPTVSGIPNMPSVLGFVYAKSKPTSTTVLSVKYPGKDVHSPLYSTWEYGKGTVSAFTSALTGSWATQWENDVYATSFLGAVTSSITPDERIDIPYTLDIKYDGIKASVEIIPATLNPNATVTLKVTRPDGSTETKKLSFDSSKYFSEFSTESVGKYTVEITYSTGKNSYTTSSVINIPYSPEFDRFTLFDASILASAIRDGQVCEESVPTLKNDESKLATYTVSFALPFMIAAIVLYIVDIIVRKLKWRDIVTLLHKFKAKGGKA